MIEGEILEWARAGRSPQAVSKGYGRWSLPYNGRWRMMCAGLAAVTVVMAIGAGIGAYSTVGTAKQHQQMFEDAKRGFPTGQVAAFAVLGLAALAGGGYLVATAYREDITIDDSGLTFESPWRKTTRISWREVQSIEHSTGSFVVRSPQGTFHISDARDGLGTLRQFLEKHAAPAAWQQAARDLPWL